jgi:ribose transport system permease protein
MINARGPRTYTRPVEVGVPYGLVVLALVASAIAIPGFLSSSHLSSMSSTAAYVGILAIGETIVLLLGGIDLSIPYTLNVAAVLLVGFQSNGMSGWLDIALVLLVGIGVGVTTGLGIAWLGISPLVMTLGMNSILQGVALIYSNGSPLGSAPPQVTTWSTGLMGGFPNVVILWIALTLVVTLVLVFTTFGRSIYSVGANRVASRLSGLPVRRTIVVAYALSGLSAALGGILLTGYSGQAYLGMGDEYLLPVIAVIVIGGTSILGGKGSYLQTVAGALLITVIESALVTIQVDQAGQDVLYGAIILFMAYLNRVAVSRPGFGIPALLRRSGGLSGWLRPPARTPEESMQAPD